MQTGTATPIWTSTGKFLYRVLFCWVSIFLISFSFPHEFVPDPGKYLSVFFEIPVRWFGDHILSLRPGYTSALVSDSTGLYIHALLTMGYALLIAVLWTLIDKRRLNYGQLNDYFFAVIRYYLALQLLMYGCSKLFRWQFYLPEPNTLFTRVGDTYKDLLYWTSMGSAGGYSIFLGVTEIIAALLLLWRKTFVGGALLAMAIFIQVTAVNFAFDISVKLYSLFLLLLSLVLLWPYGKKIVAFFFQQKQVQLDKNQPVYTATLKRPLYLLLKYALVLTIIADAFYPYLESGNLNDETAARPLFHGAYQVDTTTGSSAHHAMPWNRVFIHRQGYFIVQDKADNMQDYQLAYDTANRLLLIHDYERQKDQQLHYHTQGDSILVLQGKWGADSLQLLLRPIDTGAMPLMQQGFNWTIDE